MRKGSTFELNTNKKNEEPKDYFSARPCARPARSPEARFAKIGRDLHGCRQSECLIRIGSLYNKKVAMRSCFILMSVWENYPCIFNQALTPSPTSLSSLSLWASLSEITKVAATVTESISSSILPVVLLTTHNLFCKTFAGGLTTCGWSGVAKLYLQAKSCTCKSWNYRNVTKKGWVCKNDPYSKQNTTTKMKKGEKQTQK